MPSRRRYLATLASLTAAGLAGCPGSSDGDGTDTARPTESATAMPVPTATETPSSSPTASPTATATPSPTPTPSPTASPTPTDTPTPTSPFPLELSGSGRTETDQYNLVPNIFLTEFETGGELEVSLEEQTDEGLESARYIDIEEGPANGRTLFEANGGATRWEVDSFDNWSVRISFPPFELGEAQTPPVQASGSYNDVVGPVDIDSPVQVTLEDGAYVTLYTESERKGLFNNPLDYQGRAYFNVAGNEEGGEWTLQIEEA